MEKLSRLVRVKWIDNGCEQFDDDTEQDIPLRSIVPEDRLKVEVGARVRTRWGKGKRKKLWTAVVVDTLKDGCSASSKFQQLLFYFHTYKSYNVFQFANIMMTFLLSIVQARGQGRARAWRGQRGQVRQAAQGQPRSARHPLKWRYTPKV